MHAVKQIFGRCGGVVVSMSRFCTEVVGLGSGELPGYVAISSPELLSSEKGPVGPERLVCIYKPQQLFIIKPCSFLQRDNIIFCNSLAWLGGLST